jgi:hypothetical protein
MNSSLRDVEPATSLRNPSPSFNQTQPYVFISTENVPDLNGHLIRWIALHQERLSDCGRDLDAQALTPESIEVAATRFPPPFAWTVAATILLERLYYGVIDLCEDTECGREYILALNAALSLRQRVNYALQHNIRVAYSMEKKA